MADTLSQARRSELMSRIRATNTKPEVAIRKALHKRGWRYRLHVKGLPGTPDIVFPVKRIAIFVHGCFWHGHDCKLATVPKTRTEFWMDKIKNNRDRDRRKADQLMAADWQVVTIWQCELKNMPSAIDRIERILTGDTTGHSAAE